MLKNKLLIRRLKIKIKSLKIMKLNKNWMDKMQSILNNLINQLYPNIKIKFKVKKSIKNLKN